MTLLRQDALGSDMFLLVRFDCRVGMRVVQVHTITFIQTDGSLAARDHLP